MRKTDEEYESPSVTEYGDFEDITKQAGKGSSPEDGASKQPPGKD